MQQFVRTIGTLIIVALVSLAPFALASAETVSSPDGRLFVELDVTAKGEPFYRASFNGREVVGLSRLGFRFEKIAAIDEGFSISATTRSSSDSTWEQPWGEQRLVRDHHNEVLVTFTRTGGRKAEFNLRVRVFDDGFGFRYEMPKLTRSGDIAITRELTEFSLSREATAWWIPSGEFNRYEYIYNTTPVDDVWRAHTPMTVKDDGVYVSIHEAALVDYAGMSLDQRREGVFQAHLYPRADGALVRKRGAFTTPWRTVQVADSAAGLINSTLILNLNEPNKLGDVSWVEPGKYIGIWWAMHIRERTWGRDGIHGATTEETKRYIDFAAEHGFAGVLVEGWNVGWDGDWFHNGDLFSFTESFPDFDIADVGNYARERGVRLIGHHETSGSVTNYEKQMEDAFALYESVGVAQVKTGYVADAGDIKRVEDGVALHEWHDGQFMSNHHLRVLEAASKHKISINTHEPIKDTGLRRTYPNWISREGARGMEFNAWGNPPNPPEHETVLAYTRMLAGPMDFTPGIFDLTPNANPPVREDMLRSDPSIRPQTTLAKQLALYVVLYSPIQMAADLPENYEARPEAFQFIKDVAVDWEASRALDGEIGEFAVIARKARDSGEWFLGAITDEAARNLVVSLEFLDADKTYVAEIYRDGARADWMENPYDMVIESQEVTHADEIKLPLGAGGGAAGRFRMR